MRLNKGQFKSPKEHTVKIDTKTHDKLRHLAYTNKLTRKEVTRQAIDLYEKVNIFS
jgi:predicted transcriptional regulator